MHTNFKFFLMFTNRNQNLCGSFARNCLRSCYNKLLLCERNTYSQSSQKLTQYGFWTTCISIRIVIFMVWNNKKKQNIGVMIFLGSFVLIGKWMTHLHTLWLCNDETKYELKKLFHTITFVLKRCRNCYDKVTLKLCWSMSSLVVAFLIAPTSPSRLQWCQQATGS